MMIVSTNRFFSVSLKKAALAAAKTNSLSSEMPTPIF
jgi:hypothetical protein